MKWECQECHAVVEAKDEKDAFDKGFLDVEYECGKCGNEFYRSDTDFEDNRCTNCGAWGRRLRAVHSVKSGEGSVCYGELKRI